MSDQVQQPKQAKFKGRLSSFGGGREPEGEPEKREGDKVQTPKTEKVQTAKTVGRTIRFPPDLHRYLKAYAGLHGRDVSDLVVEEMEQFRARHPLT